MRFICLLSLLFLLVSQAHGVQIHSPKLSLPENLHKAYVYQHQEMKYVHWLYIGFAPRMQDPKRVQVVFSKSGYTMRVSVELTKSELAEYPRYLVTKAKKMKNLLEERQLEVYQWWRIQMFEEAIEAIRKNNDMSPGYSKNKYEQGLALLQEKFPSNVFPYPNADQLKANDVAAVAHFVYPITVNKEGKRFPPNAVFTMDKVYRSKFHSQSQKRQNQLVRYRIQDRRTDHGARVDTNGDGKPDTRVVTDYIFSGFPAFWIYPSPKGVGVHGPIRFSRPHESRRSEKRCETYPKKMQEFWKANEFVAAHQGFDMQKDLPSIKYRWDLIRTNNSEGCFRAEPMELRHILPSDKADIYTDVVWTITDKIDTITLPGSDKELFVDVDYYILHHYRCPFTREAWVENRIVGLSKSRRAPNAPASVEDFINNSIQFEYNDPATVEFAPPRRLDRSVYMQELNKISLENKELIHENNGSGI